MLLTVILLKSFLKIGIQSAGQEFFTAHDFQREKLTGISGKSSCGCCNVLDTTERWGHNSLCKAQLWSVLDYTQAWPGWVCPHSDLGVGILFWINWRTGTTCFKCVLDPGCVQGPSVVLLFLWCCSGALLQLWGPLEANFYFPRLIFPVFCPGWQQNLDSSFLILVGEKKISSAASTASQQIPAAQITLHLPSVIPLYCSWRNTSKNTSQSLGNAAVWSGRSSWECCSEEWQQCGALQCWE